MSITDEDVLQFRKQYMDHEGVLLSDGEAREMLSGLLLLFERFGAWIAQEKAAGREFPLDEPPSEPGDTVRPR